MKRLASFSKPDIVDNEIGQWIEKQVIATSNYGGAPVA